MEAARNRLMASLSRHIREPRVMDAMANVPRELFVGEQVRERAYDDVALSIGDGQSISQPFMVAVMTQALELTGTERVLEVGTGSGYQAAVLAQLCDRVVTVERIPALANVARARLKKLGCENVEVHLAWPEDPLGCAALAPYEAVVVTAAAPHVPQVLLAQVRTGGRIVIPVGDRDEQQLLQVSVTLDGDTTSRRLTRCRFVPLIGPDAWPAAVPSEPAAREPYDGSDGHSE
ncbi:MAG: protein-L-isoaspartate(D-aspartate) O-methyltransferase [Dehalococcoidia bacterium]|jgi:protein-L-isoaspartate(D-aspartate) O-methyltransferase|nr:protein-L-isoaspartate(D-aspartate) O-methyltransferase [Dehalococcoidia bacterium]